MLKNVGNFLVTYTMILPYNEPPLVAVSSELFSQKNLHVSVLFENLNHPTVSGNKWWKLKENLQHVLTHQYKGILTFGGAFSNHLHATSAACRLTGLKCIAVVRGEESIPYNATIQHMIDDGTTIHYCSRTEYRLGFESTYIQELIQKNPDYFVIPEGGSNYLGVEGCREWGEKLNSLETDHFILPVGTGATLAGLTMGSAKHFLGVPVLKNAQFLFNSVNNWHEEFNNGSSSYHLLTEYHFGGYAKTTPELLQIIRTAKQLYNVELDRVYTSKAWAGLLREVQRGYFSAGEKIIFIHTGGLQGNQFPN